MKETPAAAPVAALALVLALAGCGPSNTFFAGLPGVDTPFVVESVHARGHVYDVWLEGPDIRVRTFVPRNEDCHAVLEPGARVAWQAEGVAGVIEAGGVECMAVGLGTLAHWRDRRPDPIGPRGSPVPREPAYYETVYRDSDVTFLRGRFPLSTLLDWTELDDTIAVVPNVESCAPVIAGDVATMLYYPQGFPVLALLDDQERCPVLGLVQPPGSDRTPPLSASDGG